MVLLLLRVLTGKEILFLTTLARRKKVFGTTNTIGDIGRRIGNWTETYRNKT